MPPSPSATTASTEIPVMIMAEAMTIAIWNSADATS